MPVGTAGTGPSAQEPPCAASSPRCRPVAPPAGSARPSTTGPDLLGRTALGLADLPVLGPRSADLRALLAGAPAGTGLTELPSGLRVASDAAQARQVLTCRALPPPVDTERRPRRGPTPTWPRLSPADGAAAAADATSRALATADLGAVDLTERLVDVPVTVGVVVAVLGAAGSGPASLGSGAEAPAPAGVVAASLAYADAVGALTAAPRPPHRLSPLRRRAAAARRELDSALARATGLSAPDTDVLRTLLVAGVAVTRAAARSAVALHASGAHPVADPGAARALVWEALRLLPPTWLVVRFPADPLEVGSDVVRPGSAVAVSPVLLGRDPRLVPASASPLGEVGLDRWADGGSPGRWLPFGGGAHHCPGAVAAQEVLPRHLAALVSGLERRGARLVADDLHLDARASLTLRAALRAAA